jgi:hypothetical protein
MKRYQQDVYTRWSQSTARNTATRLIRGAQSNKTAKEWANPLDPAWNTFSGGLAAMGLPECSAQWLLILITQASPHKYGRGRE